MRNFFIVVLFSGVLQACVTTVDGGFEKAESVDKMVKERVSAAKQYITQRDYEAARRHLKRAMELDEQSADVHDAMALTFQATGEIELADKHFNKAISLGNGDSRYRMNYANFLFKQQEFVKSEKQLKKIIADTLYPKRESALMLMALNQQQMLKLDEAKDSFERALALNPRNRFILKQLAIINFDEGEFERSSRYFNAYRRLSQKLDAEMLLLGVQLARRLQDPDSEASFALALKNLYPESKEYKSLLREKNNQGM